MKHYIFLISYRNTETVIPKISLKMLPFQSIVTPTGNSYNVDVSYRVAVQDDSVITRYPAGTAFCVDSGQVVVQQARGLYSIGAGAACLPVSCTPKDPMSAPATDAVEQFKDYEAVHPDWNAQEGGLFDEAVKEEAKAAAAKPAATRPRPAKTVLQTINDKYPSPSVAKDSFYVSSTIWQRLVRNAAFRKRPTLLTGPTGTGKTELVMLLGKMFGLPVHIYDMGSMHDPMAQMLGVQALAAGPTGSVTKFQYAQFTRDIQQPGIILLDEFNRAPGTANNILMPLLDSRRKLFIEMAGDGEQREIDVHPECVFVATANLGSIYTATETVDAAVMDRFNVVELDYLPEAVESELLTKRTGISSKVAALISGVCSKVRQKYSENKLSRPLSTRESLLAAEYVEDGWEPLESMKMAFLPLFNGDGGSTSERSTVLNLILAK